MANAELEIAPMLLALDISTSSVKAILVAPADGAVVATASAPLEAQRPADGWSEQRAAG